MQGLNAPVATIATFATLANIGASATALADSNAGAETETTLVAGPAAMDNLVSAFGVFGYWYAETGLGLAARYQKTVVPSGVLKLASVHDDIGVEGGVDYYRYSFGSVGYDWSYNEVALLAGVVWNFWFLGDKLALYPKIELGYRFGSWSTNSGIDSPNGYGGVVIQGSAGIAYRVGVVTLRAEVGSGSLRLGAGVAL